MTFILTNLLTEQFSASYSVISLQTVTFCVFLYINKDVPPQTDAEKSQNAT